MGKVTNDEVANYYQTVINLAATSETVSRTFVENVSQVEKFMLNNALCLKLLARITEAWGRDGPLQSIYKFQVIIHKTNRVSKLITWCVATIFDLCRKGDLAPGEVSVKGPE